MEIERNRDFVSAIVCFVCGEATHLHHNDQASDVIFTIALLFVVRIVVHPDFWKGSIFDKKPS